MEDGVQVYGVEVDVALRYAPSAVNQVTRYVRVAVPLSLPNWLADVEAQLIACEVAGSRPDVVMPTASRIVDLVL
jgi:hypothetical protein